MTEMGLDEVFEASCFSKSLHFTKPSWARAAAGAGSALTPNRSSKIANKHYSSS